MINPSEIKVDVLFTQNGGFAPIMNNGVRVTHVPTGKFAESTTERSQHRNKHIALEKLSKMIEEKEMTDRELLELAAKSCKQRGLYVENHHVCDEFGVHYLTGILESKNDEIVWNPLEDDGDALRLAVKLRMDVTFNAEDVFAFPQDGLKGSSEPYHVADPYAATRRAIVRAAAEIGKGMK